MKVMCTCTEVQLLSLGENGNINGSEDEGGWMPYASLAAVTVVGVLTSDRGELEDKQHFTESSGRCRACSRCLPYFTSTYLKYF